MLTFVLSGGGAKGALQVGALRALLEAHLVPDLLVGTSVGAINAAFLAVHGFTPKGLAGLQDAWHDAAEADLLPANYLWLTVRTLFNRGENGSEQRIRDFVLSHGLSPELRFGQLTAPRLILVATDLKAGEAMLFGTHPDHSVLDGVLASTALPPWVRPLAQENRLLLDGGAISNLPIEPALTQGATEIVALDLADPRPVGLAAHNPGLLLLQLMDTIEQRQVHLEKQLAAARGIAVHHVRLRPEAPMAVWEFSRAPELVEPGYQAMKRYLAEHAELRGPRTVRRLPRWRRQWPRRTPLRLE